MTTSSFRLERAVALGLLILAVAAGCGSGEKRYNVTGKVTFDGKPVPAGIIYFEPDSTKGNTGPQSFANIHDGSYTTAVDGRGVRGGAYVIRILGFDGKVANEAPMGKSIFNEYEVKKELPEADSEASFEVPRKR